MSVNIPTNMLTNIPVNRNIRFSSFNFPVSNKEIRRALSHVRKDIADLCSVEIVSPRRNAEYGYFGRYDPGNLIIFLYAHLSRDGIYVIGKKEELEWDSARLKRKILDDTILHEVGHHVGFTRHGDLSERFADNYVRRLRQGEQGILQARY